MSDELVKRHVEQLRLTGGDLADLCQPLADAIDALIAERDSLLAGHRTLNIDGARLEDRAKAAEAERDRLRKALVFYADPETYQDIFVTEDCECCHRRENPAIEDDNGEVARAALKGESHE